MIVDPEEQLKVGVVSFINSAFRLPSSSFREGFVDQEYAFGLRKDHFSLGSSKSQTCNALVCPSLT